MINNKNSRLNYNSIEDKWVATKKIGKNEVAMEFYDISIHHGQFDWCVVLCVYHKRKHIDYNIENKEKTFSDIRHLLFARNVMIDFIKNITDQYGEHMEHTIIVHWLDNRRRIAYERALAPLGFKYDKYDGKKVLK